MNFHILTTVSAAAALCLSIPQAQATREEAQFLRTVAEQYMLAQFRDQGDGSRIEVQAAGLDERRDYGGKCEGYLTAPLQGSRITRSSQVKISCKKPGHAFEVIVPVSVRRLIPSVTAARNLARSEIISADMLRETYVDDRTNSQAAVNDVRALTGVRLKRAIKEGEQIKSGDFCMVCRGDQVNLEAQTPYLSVKTKGEALSDGNLNDQVQVRNLKTRKVVTGFVTGAGSVKIAL